MTQLDQQQPNPLKARSPATEPFVSVVMPVYNAEAVLAECLDSIFQQTFDDFELICVDDGSTDGSFDILQRYAASHSNMRVVKQSNRGQYATRNVLLELVRGKYMLSVDCDDVIAPSLIEKAVMRAEVEQADVTIVGWDYLVPGRGPSPDVAAWNLANWNRGDYSSHFPLWLGYVWMKLYRTDFLRRWGLTFREEFYSKADLIFHWKSLSLAEYICVIPEVLYHYRVHSDSTTANIGKRSVEIVSVMSVIRDELQSIGDPKGLLVPWLDLAASMIRKGYARAPSTMRRPFRDAIRGLLHRLSDVERHRLFMDRSISADTRAFYRALCSEASWRRYEMVYEPMRSTLIRLPRILFPLPLRRAAVALARRWSYSLGNSSDGELRKTIADLSHTVHLLARHRVYSTNGATSPDLPNVDSHIDIKAAKADSPIKTARSPVSIR